jgi:DNA-binding MarR family transcriptional regulator
MHGLKMTSNRMHSFLGVTGQQRVVLRVIGLLPGVSGKEIAATLQVRPSTLAVMLQRLLMQG